MTKSQYDDRDTIGTIALEAQKSNDIPVAGDLGHELVPSLVDDLNNTIASNPYNGTPFYIIIHEKKDLQLKNVILRRMVTSTKRPYPEVNTSVFWTNPKTHEVKFCWSLPHQSSFPNYLANQDRYVPEQITDIKNFIAEKLEHFGFVKTGKTDNGVPIVKAKEGFKDRPLKQSKRSSLILQK